MMTTSATEEKIFINFGWKGPSSWNRGWSGGALAVRVIDIIFKNAKSDIRVYIPYKISSWKVKKLRFTCQRFEPEIEIQGYKYKRLVKETNQNFLKVTIEQIRTLTIKAGMVEEISSEGSSIRDNPSYGHIGQQQTFRWIDREVPLEICDDLEKGQNYTLILTSEAFSFSARLIKEENAIIPLKNEQIQKIAAEIQNLNLAPNKGSTTTTEDVYTLMMQDVFRSCQEVNPEIREPQTKLQKSATNLEILNDEEIKKYFE